MSDPRPDPAPVGEIMDLVLSRIGVAASRHLEQITTQWDDIAGVPWAGRSAPLSLQDGELVVGVDDGATASLVKYDIAGLVGRLDDACGPGIVTTVTLKVVRRGRERR